MAKIQHAGGIGGGAGARSFGGISKAWKGSGMPKNTIKSMPKKTVTSGAKPKNQTSQGASVTSPRASSHQGPMPGRTAKTTVAIKKPFKTTGLGGVKQVKAGSNKTNYGTMYKQTSNEMSSAVSRTKRQLRANKKAKGIK